MVDRAPEVSTLDGRRQRRLRNRAAVVEAVFSLIQAEEGTPAVEAIAERAGVSISSIFRYFESLDDLHEQTIEHHFTRVAPLFLIPSIGEGDRSARITGFVAARLDLYDAIAPVARVARARAIDTPRIAQTLAETRHRMADQAWAHFAPELAARTPARGDDLAALIDAVTAFEAWDLLVSTHGRSRAQVHRAWTTALHALTS